MHSARSAIWTCGAPRGQPRKNSHRFQPHFLGRLQNTDGDFPRLPTRIRLIGFISLPDEDLNRGGVIGVAGIVDLWAI